MYLNLAQQSNDMNKIMLLTKYNLEQAPQYLEKKFERFTTKNTTPTINTQRPNYYSHLTIITHFAHFVL